MSRSGVGILCPLHLHPNLARYLFLYVPLSDLLLFDIGTKPRLPPWSSPFPFPLLAPSVPSVGILTWEWVTPIIFGQLLKLRWLGSLGQEECWDLSVTGAENESDHCGYSDYLFLVSVLMISIFSGNLPVSCKLSYLLTLMRAPFKSVQII